MIHNCDKCKKPILIYGRMIPCKHVFCLSCATQAITTPASGPGTSTCPRCHDKVARVEQAGLGSIYMCSHGGSRYGSNGCRRTYLSQRDLQAHIQHRHVKQQQLQASASTVTSNQGNQQQAPSQTSTNTNNSSNNALLVAASQQLPSAQEIAAATAAIVANRKRQEQAAPVAVMGTQQSMPAQGGYQQQLTSPPLHQAGPPATNIYHHHPYNSSANAGQQVKHHQSTNLITVPIQDSGATASVSGGAYPNGPQWTAQQHIPNVTPAGYPHASSYYHVGGNSTNNTSSVIGSGYTGAGGGAAERGGYHHPGSAQHHSSGSATASSLMGSGNATQQHWSTTIQQPNPNTSGSTNRTSQGVNNDHHRTAGVERGNGERTSGGGYRR